MNEITVVNGLSVDVEDWFQVGAFENTIARSDWDGVAELLDASYRRTAGARRVARLDRG